LMKGDAPKIREVPTACLSSPRRVNRDRNLSASIVISLGHFELLLFAAFDRPTVRRR
jgi:hypothetical protein